MINSPVFFFFSHFHYQLQARENFFDANTYKGLIYKISPESKMIIFGSKKLKFDINKREQNYLG